MSPAVQFPFAGIPIPERPPKPRRKGLTMMIDWGLPLELQDDCLKAFGLYVDEAKIAAGIPRVMPFEYLKRKIERYAQEGIFSFPGGLFTELAIAQGNYDLFLSEAVAAGFRGIEVSDNLLRIEPRRKKAMISKAVNDFGLSVMGEVGRKEGGMSTQDLVADVENCLEAGASLVLLEAHELFHGSIREEAFEALAGRVSFERVMFELPVTVLPDVTKAYKTKILFWLVKQFGTDVNLANVEWDEIYFTEISRRGMSGSASHPKGAYRLAGIQSAED
jgi:phosphosulfolactate synthase